MAFSEVPGDPFTEPVIKLGKVAESAKRLHMMGVERLG